MTGPLLYDLASAVMYVGGPDHAEPLVSAYLDRRVVTRAEVERGLPVMLRVRWAIQAYYFAHRIAHNDLTGIAGPAENEAGLEHARQALIWLAGPGTAAGEQEDQTTDQHQAHTRKKQRGSPTRYPMCDHPNA